MKIGNINIKHGVMLAPMAGVTDRTFRKLCMKHGAEYCVTEMISAKAVHYGDKKTAKLAELYDDEHPAAIQIFGSEPDIMAESTVALCKLYHPDVIDINMGCPMQKIVGNKEGSALMKNPSLAAEIIRMVVSASDVPVTVKLRSGWDKNSINAVEMAQLAEANGASAVCIHGRTKEQLYRPPCDLDIIRNVKKSVSIPVIGNGGINTAEDAVEMFEKTDCDGIMVARGSYGNPWIFDEILAAIEGKEFIHPTRQERIDCAIEHAKAIVADKGEFIGVLESRKHIAWYIKGINGAPEIRARINSAVSIDEIQEILYNIR